MYPILYNFQQLNTIEFSPFQLILSKGCKPSLSSKTLVIFHALLKLSVFQNFPFFPTTSLLRDEAILHYKWI